MHARLSLSTMNQLLHILQNHRSKPDTNKWKINGIKITAALKLDMIKSKFELHLDYTNPRKQICRLRHLFFHLVRVR